MVHFIYIFCERGLIKVRVCTSKCLQRQCNRYCHQPRRNTEVFLELKTVKDTIGCYLAEALYSRSATFTINSGYLKHPSSNPYHSHHYKSSKKPGSKLLSVTPTRRHYDLNDTSLLSSHYECSRRTPI